MTNEQTPYSIKLGKGVPGEVVIGTIVDLNNLGIIESEPNDRQRFRLLSSGEEYRFEAFRYLEDRIGIRYSMLSVFGVNGAQVRETPFEFEPVANEFRKAASEYSEDVPSSQRINTKWNDGNNGLPGKMLYDSIDQIASSAGFVMLDEHAPTLKTASGEVYVIKGELLEGDCPVNYWSLSYSNVGAIHFTKDNEPVTEIPKELIEIERLIEVALTGLNEGVKNKAKKDIAESGDTPPVEDKLTIVTPIFKLYNDV